MNYIQIHNRNFLIAFVVFLLMQNSVFADGRSQIDSLKYELSIAKEDSFKVNLLINLSENVGWRIGEIDTAIFYANAAFQLAQKINYKIGIASSFTNLGIINKSSGEYAEALENYLAALKILEQIGSKKCIAISYKNIGNLYYDQGLYPEALKKYFSSLNAFEEIGDKKGIAMSYESIGSTYYYQNNIPEAFKSHFAALKVFEEIGDNKGIAISYENIGSVYLSQANYPEALKNYFAALKISEKIGDKLGVGIAYSNIGIIYKSQENYPEALKNYLASLKIGEEIGDKRGVAQSYNNIGNVYSEQGNYSESLKNHFASLKIKEEIGNKRGIATTYTNIGGIYVLQDNPDEGKKWFQKGLILAKQFGHYELIRNTYANLATTDSILGNYKEALENYQQYILYRDSIINEENIKKLVQTEMLYEFDKKEIANQLSFQKSQDSLKLVQQKEYDLQQLEYEYQIKYTLAKTKEERLVLLYEEDLKRQEIENNYQQQQIKSIASQKKNEAIKKAEYEKNLLQQQNKRRNSILILSSISSLLLLSVGFAYWRFQTKKKEAQKLDAKNKKIEILIKELHHRVKNNMQIISSLLSLQSRKSDNVDVKDAFNDGINRVQAMGLIHQKLYMSEDITQVNMKDYIDSLSDNLVGSYSISNLPIRVQKDLKDISLDIDIALPLGLILNELLTNALKYGTTSAHPEISIAFDGKLLVLKDNGINAFHPGQNRNNSSFGLKLIHILCKQIRANIIFSQNNGTECRIELSDKV